MNPWEGGGPGHAGILLRKKSINSTHPHWQGPILWQYAPPQGHAQQLYTSSYDFNFLFQLILPRRAGAIILFAGSVCDSMPSMVGGSGGMLPQKSLINRCSEVHFGTLSSEIEQRKVFLRGHYSLCRVSKCFPKYIYICPKVLKKIGPICKQAPQTRLVMMVYTTRFAVPVGKGRSHQGPSGSFRGGGGGGCSRCAPLDPPLDLAEAGCARLIGLLESWQLSMTSLSCTASTDSNNKSQ